MDELFHRLTECLAVSFLLEKPDENVVKQEESHHSTDRHHQSLK